MPQAHSRHLAFTLLPQLGMQTHRPAPARHQLVHQVVIAQRPSCEGVGDVEEGGQAAGGQRLEPLGGGGGRIGHKHEGAGRLCCGVEGQGMTCAATAHELYLDVSNSMSRIGSADKQLASRTMQEQPHPCPQRLTG